MFLQLMLIEFDVQVNDVGLDQYEISGIGYPLLKKG